MTTAASNASPTLVGAYVRADFKAKIVHLAAEREKTISAVIRDALAQHLEHELQAAA